MGKKVKIDCGEIVFYSSKVLTATYVISGGLIASGRIVFLPEPINWFVGGSLIACGGLVHLMMRDDKRM